MKTIIFHSFSQRIILLILVLIFVFGATLKAQNRQMDAKKFINHTNLVLRETAKIVKKNRVYTGNFTKAVRHQKLAITLYRNGEIKKAVKHSYRARQLSVLCIKANRTNIDKALETNKVEQRSVGRYTLKDEEQLDGEIQGNTSSDEDSVNQIEKEIQDITE